MPNNFFSAIMLVCFLACQAFPAMAPTIYAQSRMEGPQSARPDLKGKIRFSEQKHRQFMQNGDYASADALLNATWQILKENLTNARFREVQASQREWLKQGREKEAADLLDTHSEPEAFAIAIRNRANVLASVLSAPPMAGKYSAAESQFKTAINGHTVSLEGDAFHGQNTCDYKGIGKVSQGWTTMRHDDFPDFYVLFTKRGAFVRYSESGASQGCGFGVDFADDYVYDGN